MRTTLAAILAREGYEVPTAGTGEKALERCRTHSYALILMDVRMPGMGGVEVFRQIRRHQEGVRIILMSAYSVDDLKRQALDEGAIAFLSKPLDVPTVVRLIKDTRDTAILVVGQDEPEASNIAQALTNQGYHATRVSLPHDALELIEQIRFDIVLIDATLPSMTGLDLYLAIKKITPSAVAIMVSGLNAEAERIAREAVQQTAYTMVHKPINLDHLFDLLQKLTRQQLSGDVHKPPLDDL